MKKESRNKRDNYLSNRDEAMCRVMLGMDDGTDEAAMAESVDFGKFLDEIDESDARASERYKDARRDRPMLEEQRRHRERDHGHRVSFARRKAR